MKSILLLMMGASISLFGAERRNLSIDDVISGFKDKKLVYFQIILENSKYQRTLNKCLSSKPADSNWLKTKCQKKPDLKNAFQCQEDSFTHVFFFYEDIKKCEETRGPMKDKMDAIK